jgi:hypothetical protein
VSGNQQGPRPSAGEAATREWEALDRAARHEAMWEEQRMDQLRNIPGGPQIQADAWRKQKPPKRAWWRRVLDRIRRNRA